MSLLFDRVSNLTVSTLDLSGFRYKFHVEKSIKPEPNHVRIEVYNLSPEHRSALAELAPGKRVAKKKKKKGISPNLHGKIPVRLEAGYKEDGPQQIFLGDLTTVDSERDGADWITTITSGDGERAYRTARISQAFRSGANVASVMRAIVKTLGMGEGNLESAIRGVTLQGGATVYPRGIVLSGSAARAMTDLCRSAQLEWSCQDGALSIVNQGQALASKAVKLTPATGLVGSPNVDGDGILKAKTLMIPDLRIGRLVVVDSVQVKGNFRVEKIVTDGDTHGTDWGHEIEAKRY